MLKLEIAFFLLLILAGCASGPSPLARANADGNRTAAVGEGFVRAALSSNPCPAGYLPARVRMRASSDADFTNYNGDIDYYMGVTGNRSQECVAY